VDRILEEGAVEEVDDMEVTAYAEQIGARVFKTSAKTGTAVDDLFYKIAEDYSRRTNAPPSVYSANVALDKGQQGNQGNGPCCGSS
tara:strand:+ start:717 stop:974 length:258 start_codon:yes stop_codon:yes gene_type:complete